MTDTTTAQAEMLTLQHAHAYGISIVPARRLTDDEKMQYSEHCRDRIFAGLADHPDYLDLPQITWRDLPKRRGDGEFDGCGNVAWIITREEADRLIAINNERAEQAARNADANAKREARWAEQDRRNGLCPLCGTYCDGDCQAY